ncbi:MAG: hypothetical protein AABW79_01695 [Nanoarchaeota archaeon]
MHQTLKRHDKVKLLRNPDPEYTEYYSDEKIPIKSGQIGKINVILPNGRYHIRIESDEGEELAYVVMDEESLEKIND